MTGQGEPEETTDSFLATSLWHIPYYMDFNKAMKGDSRADRNLIQDAPKILKAYEEKCEEVKRLREQNKLMMDYFWYMRNGGFTDADDLLTKINELIGDE